jgi:hypothetical protein
MPTPPSWSPKHLETLTISTLVTTQLVLLPPRSSKGPITIKSRYGAEICPVPWFARIRSSSLTVPSLNPKSPIHSVLHESVALKWWYVGSLNLFLHKSHKASPTLIQPLKFGKICEFASLMANIFVLVTFSKKYTLSNREIWILLLFSLIFRFYGKEKLKKDGRRWWPAPVPGCGWEVAVSVVARVGWSGSGGVVVGLVPNGDGFQTVARWS